MAIFNILPKLKVIAACIKASETGGAIQPKERTGKQTEMGGVV
jgi:hypothetical protein